MTLVFVQSRSCGVLSQVMHPWAPVLLQRGPFRAHRHKLTKVLMAEYKNASISPTVKKVLDEYVAVLHADEEIDNEAADRLDTLLREGKVPKFGDVDAALFPPPKGDSP
jgi:hypothetical protein